MTDYLRNETDLESESGYARGNLFVGKYGIPKNGHISLPNAKVRVLMGVETPTGWVQDSQGAPWLIVQDGDFWPVMVRLDPTSDQLPAVAASEGMFWMWFGLGGTAALAIGGFTASLFLGPGFWSFLGAAAGLAAVVMSHMIGKLR
jgi:hypothetical protein